MFGSSASTEVRDVVEDLVVKGDDDAEQPEDEAIVADRRLAPLRRQPEHTAHLVTMILGDFMRYRYMRILVRVSRPMWAEHQE